MTVEYRVLGPLEVLLDGVPVAVPAGRGRVLLATLLLRPNKFVSVSELVERVWDGAPPDLQRAHKTLHMTVRRLRQALGAANCVRTEAGGYRAEVSAHQLDLSRFRALAAAGEHAAALALWRGSVLADVASETVHRDDVALLVEERLVALEQRIDADLAAGKARGLVPELQELTREHPLRDAFWRQLMLALYRSGRQAGALETYRQVSAMLADELGIDPAPALAELHEQILLGQVPASEEQRVAVPRQLPRALTTFAGREAELRRLDGSTAEVLVLTGSGGVGKTALAVNWGHRAAARFPDGQIFVNLRGQDPAQRMSPQVALSLVLKGLGVGTAPVDLDEQVALYRSLVADRTILLVLDNVAGPEQVRPLLPGSGTSLTLVTSRADLRGLALHDAEFVRLSTLSDEAGVRLLEQVLGHARVAAELEAAHRLVRLCAGLPLALRIAAADLGVNDYATIEKLVSRLHDDRLGELAVPGDPAAAVGVVFDESYSSLPEEARVVFRRLGVLPGADFTADDAAVVSGLPAARGVLEHLVGTHLVERCEDDRFELHDLLRVYARELCEQEETGAAIQRLYDFYRRMVDDVGRLCFTDRDRLPLETTSTQLPDVVLRTAEEGFAWLRAEHVNLLAMVRVAADRGDHWPASQIGTVLGDFYYNTLRDDTRWSALIEVRERVARESGEDVLMAFASHAACIYHFVQGNHALARRCARTALELARRAGHLPMQASSYSGLGVFAQIAGDLDEAAEHYQAGVAAYTEIGSVEGRARILMNLATVRFQQGDLPGAERDQLEVLDTSTSPSLIGDARANAAVISLELGRFADALAHMEQYQRDQGQWGAGQNPMAISFLIRTKVVLGHLDEAFDLALDMFEEVRSTVGVEEENNCWIALASVLDASGAHEEVLAIGHVLLRLTAGEELVTDRAQAHCHVARSARLLGDHDTAARHLREMRADIAEAYPLGMGEELRERALLHLALGESGEALRCAEEAVAVHRRFHQRYHEAKSLAALAGVREAGGDVAGARAAEALAASAYRDCGVPERP